MALVHNVFLRGLNSIILQGPNVRKEQDVIDFFLYCETWILIVEHHHEIEETHFFVDLEKLHQDLDVERDQHKQIHDGLDKFEAYIKNTSPKSYEWTDLKAILDSFTTVFTEHLHREIQTLLALRDSNLTQKQLKTAWDKTEQAAIKAKLPNLFVSFKVHWGWAQQLIHH
jgi:hypothetical protein